MKQLMSGSDILADDAVQRFQGRLPELFNCRNLSDSFGAIVGAAINALNNRRGDPLSSPANPNFKECYAESAFTAVYAI